MAEQAEQAFVKAFLNTLSTQSVTYPDDYQQPPENSLKKVPVLAVDVPAPPERKQEASTSSASISVLFKSLKPPASFTISVQPTDTISAIKSQLASQPSAPPADAQRLLLKGKALADGKLLKEYSIKDGDTVNLMIKPGFDWDPSKPTTSSPSPMDISPSPVPSIALDSSKSSLSQNQDSKPSRKHQRIPSVVLSPSPSSESPSSEKPMDITLTLDTSTIEGSFSHEPLSTYHATVAKPEFWGRLHAFLRSEFSTEGDALLAFEDFLCATKGTLSASEIAKIRDQVGVVGMAGT